MNLRIRLCTAALWAAAAAARAQDGSADASSPAVSPLRLSGFGTLGATYAEAPHGWGFLREFMQPPNSSGLRGDIDSRLGLQANYVLSPRLEAVAQVVLRDRVKPQKATDSLEWGFVNWHAGPDTTVRLGRISAALYMLADQRNVGFASATVRPPVDFYGALPLYWVDGGDISHSWDSADGDVRWTARARFGVHAHAKVDNGSDEGTIPIESNRLVVASLGRVEGSLRMQVQAGRLHLQVEPNEMILMGQQGLAAVQPAGVASVSAEAAALSAASGVGQSNVDFLSIGTEYEIAPWSITAELGRISGGLRLINGRYGYATLSRRFGDTTLSASYGVARSTSSPLPQPQWEAALTPVVGAATAAQFQALGLATWAINTAGIRQSSYGLAARFDLSPQTALKLQWDHFDVRANGAGLWSNSTPDAGHANVGSIALDFIF